MRRTAGAGGRGYPTVSHTKCPEFLCDQPLAGKCRRAAPCNPPLPLPASVCPDSAPRSESSRSEEHTSELQSLMRNSYAVFCLKKKNKQQQINIKTHHSAKYNKT